MAGDSELIERARRGDREAFGALCEARRERLIWFSYRITGNIEDARDIVQSAFLRAWEFFADYDPVRPFGGWIFKIAYHIAVDRVRWRRRWRISPLKELLSSARKENIDLEISLHAAVSQLPPRRREAFVLTLIEGFSSDEAGEIMDISPSTVRNLVRQAQIKLREILRSS